MRFFAIIFLSETINFLSSGKKNETEGKKKKDPVGLEKRGEIGEAGSLPELPDLAEGEINAVIRG